MRRWFLPESPDLLGLLGRQGEITIAAMDALCAWSDGDRSAGATVHALDHDGDQASREVLAAVKAVPGDLGRGVFWWHPESVTVSDMPVWVGGSCALFDRKGEVLPAAGCARPPAK